MSYIYRRKKSNLCMLMLIQCFLLCCCFFFQHVKGSSQNGRHMKSHSNTVVLSLQSRLANMSNSFKNVLEVRTQVKWINYLLYLYRNHCKITSVIHTFCRLWITEIVLVRETLNLNFICKKIG